MKILFLGDIVGRLGRQTTALLLPSLRKGDKINLVLGNAENLASGRGATRETISEVVGGGVDYLTSGNHIFWQDALKDEIEHLPVLRPANYPPDVPGRGYVVIDGGAEGRVLLINLLGRTFIDDPVFCPFRRADEVLAEFKEQSLAAIIVDFHAEATSERRAMGFYLDGRVSAVVGTHTHVPSADARILPRGTAFVSDVGMVGPRDSVLGVEPEDIIAKLKYPYPRRFRWVKKGEAVFNSVLIETSGSAASKSIKRVDEEAVF